MLKSNYLNTFIECKKYHCFIVQIIMNIFLQQCQLMTIISHKIHPLSSTKSSHICKVNNIKTGPVIVIRNYCNITQMSAVLLIMLTQKFHHNNLYGNNKHRNLINDNAFCDIRPHLHLHFHQQSRRDVHRFRSKTHMIRTDYSLMAFEGRQKMPRGAQIAFMSFNRTQQIVDIILLSHQFQCSMNFFVRVRDDAALCAACACACAGDRCLRLSDKRIIFQMH